MAKKTGKAVAEAEENQKRADDPEIAPGDRRLNWQQACELLHCGRGTFYRLVQSGKLNFFGVGMRGKYVKKSDCMRLLVQKELEK